MRPAVRTFLLSIVAGAVITAIAAARVPDYQTEPKAAITRGNPDGSREESFYFSTADGIAITHGGRMPLGAAPPGVGLFDAKAIERGFVLVANTRDRDGDIVGFAVELEVHPERDMLAESLSWDSEWILVLPGRGMLILHQQEHSSVLGPKVINPVLETGVPWEGRWQIQTTVGPRPDKRGIIIGGTGEFAGASGSFVEIDTLHRFTPDGLMEGDFELKVRFDGEPDDA